MDLKGTKTEKNLMEAFAGESQARNKYTYYASQAKKDGYVQIAQIFEEDGLIECAPLPEAVVEWEPRLIWHEDTDKSTFHQFFRATLISSLKRKFPAWFVGA